MTKAINTWLAIGLVLIMAVVTVGCDSSAPSASKPASTVAPGQGSSQVKPLQDILAGGPTFNNLTSNSVTVLLNTKIPVVCAAAYGTDTGYGHLSTDTDMAGGAHQNHHPVLGGLQPNTEYHIRLQGVGPDGTLYQSGDYTLRTPAASGAQGKPSGDNLALLSKGARISGVSSTYGGGGNDSTYGANHAIDGDPSTQWSSNGDGNKAWIEIELPNQSHVTSLGFWTRTMGTSAQIRSFRVVTDAGKTYGPFTLPDATGIHYFPVDLVAKRLRFEVVDSSGGNTGSVEIEVYGRPSE